MYNKFHNFLSVMLGIVIVNGELYTAVNDMEDLLYNQATIIANLNVYISVQELKLEHITKIEDEFSIKNQQHLNSKIYVHDLISSYLTIKRMARDWMNITQLIGVNLYELILNHTLVNKTETRKMPTEVDLYGMAVGLARLQQTYKLKTSDLAAGRLRGVHINVNMSASDCYELGVQIIATGYEQYSAQWLNESLIRLSQMPNSKQDTELKLDILQRMVEIHTKQQNHELALDAIENLLEMRPNDTVLMSKKLTFQTTIKEQEKSFFQIRQELTKRIEKDIVSEKHPIDHTDPFVYDEYQELLSESVCRGDHIPTSVDLAPLRCRYFTTNSAFLKIAPLKLEEISLDPYIVKYHQVLYEPEIELIISMAKPRLKRSGVLNYNKTSEIKFVDYRVSKSTWLLDHQHKSIKVISDRIADMTGLSMLSAESLHVVNYGIGGLFSSHFDWTRTTDKTFENSGAGNRIATVLFYMTDVEEGGATAFPLIKKVVFPEKGSAVFWLNLHASGEGDVRTKHAGCPVLVGNKWVANKWLHSKHQELIRPCGLFDDNLYIDIR